MWDMWPPCCCMWKARPWVEDDCPWCLVVSQNLIVTLPGTNRGSLNRAVTLTGAVMTPTPDGTTEKWEGLTGTAENTPLHSYKICYLCAFLFQPSRQTASRDSVRYSQRAWLRERGADRGRSQRRTIRTAGQQSWELWAPPASHFLAQAHLADLSEQGHITRKSLSQHQLGERASI